MDRRKKRAKENRLNRERRDDINEIAPIPTLSKRERRLRDDLENDPASWLREILPDIFFADFNASQLEFIDLAWRAIVDGSWRNIEAYRGFGKTSLLSGLLFKALCEGIVRHAIYVTAEGGASASQAATWFFSALYDDYQVRGKDARLFTRLYPEIAYPIQRREGKAQRPLTCGGVPLGIELKSDRIVLPRVPGSRCCGSLLRFASIGSGGLRGSNHTIPGVGSFRVRCVMLDDVQNDATARSVVEVDSVISTIQKTARGLAGRRKDGSKESLTILSAITQNQPGDVAERMITEIPEFGTVVIPFVKRLPDDFDEWKRYRDYRDDVLRKKPIGEARQALSAYYAERKDLFKGVVVDDDRAKENWQVDSIHYALDYWAASESSFWCEFQNDARRAVEVGGGLAVVDVARKLRTNAEGVVLKRCQVPSDVDVLVAHIDAGEHYLNYEVCGYSKDFSIVHVVDFGVFPDQPGGLASKKKYLVDLQDEYVRGDKFDRLRDATLDLLIRIFTQQYFDENGGPLPDGRFALPRDGENPSPLATSPLDYKPCGVHEATDFVQHARARGRNAKNFCRLALCGVDCSDGEMELALWDACSAFHKIEPFEGRAIPCYGVESASRLLRYYDLKPGEWRRERRTGAGYDWIENAVGRAPIARGFPRVYASLTYDANTAKTRRDAAWKLPLGREGGATVCLVDEPELLQFARHQTAEDFTVVKKSGIEYRRWKMKKPRISDNEFLDTDAACRALAEYVGCEVRSRE